MMTTNLSSRHLLAFLVVLGVFLAASSAAAQPKLTMPALAAHPRTGEPGTWIPRWLEKEHVVDAHDLKVCRTALLDNADIEVELKLQVKDLQSALDHEQAAADRVDAAIAAGAKRAAGAEKKAERRARALWGAGGALAVSIIVTVISLAVL